LSIYWLAAVRALFGDSLLVLRLTPAILGAAAVAVVGGMVRSLGGGRWALALAMTGALVAPEYLALHHYYSMNAFDILFWALAAWILIRLVQDESLAKWLLLGTVLGFGLLNKISVLWLGAGLLVGILATPLRRSLARPGPWLAGLVAAAIFSPYVVWEMRHDWPTREFIHNATAEKMAAVAPLDFLIGQVETFLPFAAPLWLAGLAWLLFHARGRDFRLLGWLYLTVFAILAFAGSSRASYLAPAYTWLFAAGGVALESALEHERWRWVRPAFLVLLLVAGTVVAPLKLPILPVESYLRHARALGQEPSTEENKELGELGQFFADMHGWDAMVDTIAEVFARLSPEEAATARVFAPDYGVAGAIDLLGRRRGLPAAISGHNNYWLWGPRGWDGRVVIVVGGEEEQLRPIFAGVERAATLECGRCMPYENHRPVWIARGLVLPVDALWSKVKHYD
jgi:hypothetical protein